MYTYGNSNTSKFGQYKPLYNKKNERLWSLIDKQKLLQDEQR